MFSQEESKAISDDYVAVRLTGGRDITDEVRSFMEKYGVRGYPTMYVMNADGHVVNADVSRTTEGILEALAKGDELEKEFKALGGKDDVESKTKRATLLADRMQYDAAKEALDELVESSPSAGVYEALAEYHQTRGETDAELEVLGKLITDYPDADNQTKWRVRVAVAPTDDFQRRRMARDEALGIATGALESLREIFDEVTAAEAAPAGAEAEVRGHKFPLLAMLQQRDECEEHVDWLIENAADTDWAPKALWQRGIFQINDKDWEDALATFNGLMDKYPESQPGQAAPRAIDYIQKQQATDDSSDTEE